MRYLWYSMYGFVTALAVYALFFRPAAPHPDQPVPVPVNTPVAQELPIDNRDVDVQIALLLDTSSSMDGLVAQARTELWEMVSELQVGANGEDRSIEVAVYQYGNNRLSRADGFIEQLTPLTSDLDMVTVKLHSLRTTGGKEYAPQAIVRAVDDLAWVDDDEVEKVIVVAGNEGFNQGTLSVQKAMKAAADKSIMVMPIFCANRGATRNALTSWKSAAELAGTDFSSIDPDQQVAQIETPYDQMIIAKCRELDNYRVYSPQRKTSSFAGKASGYAKGSVGVDRALVQTRQAANYDLATNYANEKLPGRYKAALPKAVASKSESEQQEYLRSNAKKQAKIKKEIAELNAKRKSHVAKKMKEIPTYQVEGKQSLGVTVRKNMLKSY